MTDRSKPVEASDQVWMNVRQLASYIDSTEAAVRVAVHRRQLPFTKRGSRLLFKRAAIDEMLEAASVPANA